MLTNLTISSACYRLARSLEQQPTPIEPAAAQSLRATPLQELEISIRAFNSLNSAGIKTLGQLAGLTRRDLQRIPNIGPRTIRELEAFLLCSYGLKLK